MIAAWRPRRRAACYLPALTLAAALALSAAAAEPSADAALPQTLDELMTGMASTRGVVAEFTEIKRMALLAAPLQTRGTLYFVPPDRMLRATHEPAPSWLWVDGRRLRFRDRAGGDDVELGDNPVARQFVDNFVVLFNGNREELERRYRVEFAAEEPTWQLSLRPRRAPLRDLIESIALRGDSGGMREMTMVETDGDSTTTIFSKVDADHRFSDEELARLFTDPIAAAPR